MELPESELEILRSALSLEWRQLNPYQWRAYCGDGQRYFVSRSETHFFLYSYDKRVERQIGSFLTLDNAKYEAFVQEVHRLSRKAKYTKRKPKLLKDLTKDEILVAMDWVEERCNPRLERNKLAWLKHGTGLVDETLATRWPCIRDITFVGEAKPHTLFDREALTLFVTMFTSDAKGYKYVRSVNMRQEDFVRYFK